MLAFVRLGPSRQLQIVPFEVIGPAGLGIYFRRDNVQVRIALVVVRCKKRAGISHAHRRQGVLRRSDHLFPCRLLAGSPA